MAIAKEIRIEQRVMKHRLQNDIQIACLTQIKETSDAFFGTRPFIGVRTNIELFR